MLDDDHNVSRLQQVLLDSFSSETRCYSQRNGLVSEGMLSGDDWVDIVSMDTDIIVIRCGLEIC